MPEKRYEFFEYEPYLSESTFDHLQNCSMNFNTEQYFASAVWGAVFLEGFLADFMRELKAKKTDFKVLNDYIEHLRNFNNREGNNEIKIPQEIIYRCNLIREIRNGLVHDTGHSKDSAQSAADMILDSIQTILKVYTKNFSNHLERIIKENETINDEDLIPVFISTVNPDTEFQRFFLESFSNRLRKMGIKPVRVTIGKYQKKDPIGRVTDTVLECEAMIVIGLERSHAYFLRDRVGGEKQKDKIHKKYSSGWLHLEAGIASALNKDVFVTCQSDIYSDGIFDRDWNSYPVIEFEWQNNVKHITNLLKPDSKNELNQDFFANLEEWVQEKKRS
ncbi:hypothetical protein [Neobacillus dielmonensis]|uniref:hypothetical protein n=1 Tax=Neobacillus dielmonensis TaxID=1347369 RepID=UPI0005A79057|nr:hypothetical protein [Neobacillus dielmonensis]